jgi:hypothetical protein
VLRFYCDLNVECEDSPPLHRFGIRNPKLHQGHGVAPGTGGGPFRIFCALRLYPPDIEAASALRDVRPFPGD